MANKKFPGLWAETGTDGKISVLMTTLDGREERLPPVTPAEDLIAAVEIDYAAYRQEIRRLYEEHPLFEEQLDVSMLDLEDLTAEVLRLSSMLQEIDPLSFFEVSWLLDQALRMKDDCSALFLLRAGWRLLRILEIPIHTQIRLRNIMEMAFDEMERATQQERFERLHSVYPQITEFCNPTRLDGYEDVPLQFRVDSVFQLRLAELLLYFRQDKNRIVRCDSCWNYFIPKTRAVTLYCDRVFDGQSCKRRGANLKRNQGLEQDKALRNFKRLKERMYTRMERYRDAAESQRKNLISMTLLQYGEWEDNAYQARRDYKAGKISAEEFLRRIDITRELECYDTVKQEQIPEESVWQKRVAADLDFDPAQKYPPMLSLDLGTDNPQWEYLTPEDLMREDQKGHQSLQDKYRKNRR